VVWIDPVGLRGQAGDLAALREEMAPSARPAPPTTAAVPSAALQASIAAFDQVALQACVDSAQQVDGLSADAMMAATQCAGIDAQLGAALRAVPR
jgi:hypothetical protein